MSSRAAQKEERKRQILAAAMAVFARKGFDGASMDDIVQESGLSKGGLYWHFESKDDIIAAILAQFFDQEMGALAGLVAASGSVEGRLRALAGQVVADMEAAADLHPIALESFAVAARQVEVRQMLQGYYRQYGDLLAALVEQGVDAGEFRNEVATGRVAMVLIAQFEGLALLWTVNPEDIDLQAQSEAAVDLLLNGLKKQSAKEG